MAGRKPKTRWDDDPSSAKNTYKRANERGRQTLETEFRSNVFPRSPKAPRYFVPRAYEGVNSMASPQRRVQAEGFRQGRSTRYSRLTGGGAAPGQGMSGRGQGGGGGGFLGRTK